jgi:hypothetical protein
MKLQHIALLLLALVAVATAIEVKGAKAKRDIDWDAYYAWYDTLNQDGFM